MIPQYEPKFNTADLNTEFVSYFEAGGWMTEFKKTMEFEDLIKDFLGVKHAFCVNNGTISLSLALMAHGITAGDKVITPALSMIATANAIRLIGAEPVFVDIDKHNLCLNLNDTINKLHTEDIKGVIYVSLNGRSHSPDQLHEVKCSCEEVGACFIEDAAQSFGSKRPLTTDYIGNDSHITSFSFSMPKIITTGQGGVLVTNNDEMALNIKRIKDFGRESGGNDVHDHFGINSKFTDLQAMVGISQMRDIQWRTCRKKAMYELYYHHLKDCLGVFMLPPMGDNTPWFMDIFTHYGDTGDRDELATYLEKKGIGTRAIYPPIYSQKIYYGKKLNSTDFFCARGLWLPSSFELTNYQIKEICDTIKEYYK